MTPRPVIAINAGSSSLKASLVEGDRSTAVTSLPWASGPGGRADRSATLQAALDALAEAGGQLDRATAVAHRVVHGGSRFTAPVVVDEATLAAIAEATDLAPLHNAAAVETIREARRTFPALAHVACFDTAFHADLPATAARYPVPEAWATEWGIRRFGFHGLSVEWAVRRAAELLARPADRLGLVVAHLGSGCSVTAIAGGRSAWTSMGFTPLEGLMMGTRSGSLDPGILVHLLRRGRLDLDELAATIERRSGLLGVSGRSADVRDLEAAAGGGDERARLALAMFADRAAAGIAAAATALPALDAVVFSGGIGEHAAGLRATIVGRLAVLGLEPIAATDPGVDAVLAPLDGPRHAEDGGPARPAVLRIAAREDLVMAAAAATLLGSPSGVSGRR